MHHRPVQKPVQAPLAYFLTDILTESGAAQTGPIIDLSCRGLSQGSSIDMYACLTG